MRNQEGTQPELKGLQIPSDLSSTPGPHHTPAWGASRKESRVCRYGNLGTRGRYPERTSRALSVAPIAFPDWPGPKPPRAPETWPRVADLGCQEVPHPSCPGCVDSGLVLKPSALDLEMLLRDPDEQEYWDCVSVSDQR